MIQSSLMGFPIREVDSTDFRGVIEVRTWDQWERDRIIAMVESEFPGSKVHDATLVGDKWNVTVSGVDPDVIAMTTGPVKRGDKVE